MNLYRITKLYDQPIYRVEYYRTGNIFRESKWVQAYETRYYYDGDSYKHYQEFSAYSTAKEWLDRREAAEKVQDARNRDLWIPKYGDDK